MNINQSMLFYNFKEYVSAFSEMYRERQAQVTLAYRTVLEVILLAASVISIMIVVVVLIPYSLRQRRLFPQTATILEEQMKSRWMA